MPVVRQSGDYMGKSRIPKHSRRRLLCWAFGVAATAAGRTKSNLGNYYRRKKKQKKIAKVVTFASTISDTMYKVLTAGEPYMPRAS